MNTVLSSQNLVPLPHEGGFYREVLKYEYWANQSQHSVSTILYAVTPSSISALHKLTKSEVYFYHGGKPLEIFTIAPTGITKTILLGPDPSQGQVLQFLIEPNTWQGSRIFESSAESDYSLIGALVFPKFEWSDFELANRTALIAQYPAAAEGIIEFTR